MTQTPNLTFSDAQGRTWSCAVTVATVARVRRDCGVDLMELATGDLWSRLASDPVLMVTVLASVLRPQLQAAGVSDEAFAESLAGDALQDAMRALIAGCVGFFPNQATRTALQTLAAKVDEMTDAVGRQAVERIAAMDLSQLLDSGGSSTSSPASSGSTQDR